MVKSKNRFLGIAYWIIIIGIDIFIYMILGILQMDYDDNYDISKGEYWSFESMNKQQLIYFGLLQIWNIVNVIGLTFIGNKIYKQIKYGN